LKYEMRINHIINNYPECAVNISRPDPASYCINNLKIYRQTYIIFFLTKKFTTLIYDFYYNNLIIINK